MNWKTWVPLVLAVVLGVVAAKVARDVIVRGRTAGPNTSKFAKIVVANNDITPGRELTAETLELSQVDVDHIPSGSFTNIAVLQGRVAEQLMVKGQAVLEPMLVATGATPGFHNMIPVGMRAITVEVNEFSSVAGLILPGCRVDVIATIQGVNGDSVARTIVQNVKVTAVGQRTTAVHSEPKPGGDPSQDSYKSVTMLCTPQDAEAIELANSLAGRASVLRSSRDSQLASAEGVTVSELRRGIGRSGGDPFGPSATGTSRSSTQPSNAFEELPARRAIKVIRAGVETVVSMALEAPPIPAATDTATTANEEADLFE